MLRRLAGRIGKPNLLIVALSLSFVTYNAIKAGLTGADQSSSVIAALLALLALVSPSGTPRYEPISAVSDQIVEQVGGFWRGEARKRNLDELRFVPPKIEIISGLGSEDAAEEYLTSLPTHHYWSLVDMRRVCAGAVYRFGKVRRSIVYGEPGTGKSTLALALTLGLIDRVGRGDRLIPLTLSLSTWDVREEFASWLNRRLENAYPALRLINGEVSGGRAGALMNSSRFMFILDGLDELPVASTSRAVGEINKFFDEEQYLCILTRQGRLLPELRGAVHLRLALSDIASVRAHLTSLSSESSSSELAPILREISKHPGGNLAELLRRPLYLNLMYESLIKGQVKPGTLIKLAAADVDSAKTTLFSALVNRALGSTKFLRRPRARWWLLYFAGELHARDVRAFAWWRIGDAVPRLLMICTVVTTVVPSYALGLLMPVGLTRGLTVGVMSGIVLGMLRGYSVDIMDLPAPFVLSWILVFGTGAWWVGAAQAAIDAFEISLAIALCLALKDRLLLDRLKNGPRIESAGKLANLAQFLRVWYVAIAVLVGGTLVAALTKAMSGAAGFVDPKRGLISISYSVALGLTVAAVAARLLINSKGRMQPSGVQLRFAPRPGGWLRPLWSGIMAATLIGAIGGIGGGSRLGQQYGVSLFLFFGVTIGVPVGVVGGVVKWLNSPIAGGGGTTSGSTLRSDRVVAICSMGALSIAGTASILVMYRYLQGPIAVIRSVTRFELHVTHGVLLGLTMGIVVACFNTAWPTYFVGHLWLAVVRVLPWRMAKFLRELHEAELLRQEGALFLFRHRELQVYLASEYRARRN